MGLLIVLIEKIDRFRDGICDRKTEWRRLVKTICVVLSSSSSLL